jgi:hypothetical protein
MTTENATSVALGSKVYLRACRAGEPGTVIRFERGRFTVYWRDMDFWSRHVPEALEIAPSGFSGADPDSHAW